MNNMDAGVVFRDLDEGVLVVEFFFLFLFFYYFRLLYSIGALHCRWIRFQLFNVKLRGAYKLV